MRCGLEDFPGVSPDPCRGTAPSVRISPGIPGGAICRHWIKMASRDPSGRLTGSSSPELPAAQRQFAVNLEKLRLFPRTFQNFTSSRRRNSLEPPRQGPLTSHCRPPTFVFTVASLLDPFAPFCAHIHNGFDRSKRAWNPVRLAVQPWS